MAKFDDAQTITGEVNINYVLTAYSKKLNSIMGENILLQAKVSELEEQNNNLSNEFFEFYDPNFEWTVPRAP